MPMFDVLRSWFPLLGSVLISSLWQGLLLIVGSSVALRLMRFASPAKRSMFLVGMLGLVLLLPVASTLHSRAGGIEHVDLHVTHPWVLTLVWAWASLSLWRAVQFGRGALRAYGIARSATPVQPSAELQAVLRGGPKRALRPAALYVSRELNRPSVLGFVRPRILLPDGLLDTLSRMELEHVVLHEMEHLRRLDDWLNLLQQVSLVLMPWNPALLWLDRRLCVERELACDDGVLQRTASRTTYAGCLVKLAEAALLRQGVVLAMSALGTRAGKSELVCRVQRILAGQGAGGGTRLSPASSGLTVVVVFLAGWLAWQSPAVHFEMGAGPQRVAALHTPSTASPWEQPEKEDQAPGVRGIERSVVYRTPGRQGLTASVPQVRHTSFLVRHRKARVRLLRNAVGRPATTLLPREGGQVVRTRWTGTKNDVSTPSYLPIVYAAVPFQDGWLLVRL